MFQAASGQVGGAIDLIVIITGTYELLIETIVGGRAGCRSRRDDPRASRAGTKPDAGLASSGRLDSHDTHLLHRLVCEIHAGGDKGDVRELSHGMPDSG